MQESYILGKMNNFMRRLAEHMSSWMGQRLPEITDEWWNELVYNKLTPLQKELVDSKNITELSGLDLASLLRVFDRNWFVIKDNWFINPKYCHPSGMSNGISSSMHRSVSPCFS